MKFDHWEYWFSRSHAAKRAFERYGARLTLDDLDAMAEAIQSGKAKLIRNTLSFYVQIQLVYCEKIGHFVPVVYDRQNNHIITVLKLEHVIEGCQDDSD